MRFQFLTLLFIMSILGLNAQGQQTCHFGITFEISDNPSWGYGEPVVLAVQPHSPADKAGVKVGDIIMEINGIATYLRNNETIASWLFNQSSEEATFTIRNLNTYFKEYKLSRLCKDVNSMSEADIASAFSFYSLENMNERSFILPLKTVANDKVDYSDYHTYDFLMDENAPEVDAQIISYLEKTLAKKGLVREAKEPDFLVQTYYSFLPNPKYSGLDRPVFGKDTWRFDSDAKQLTLVPILAGNEPDVESKGQYILELGVRFLDKKYIESKELVQIWDCNTKEYLTAQYDLGEYARVHVPLMLMQFPLPTAKASARYIVSTQKYNYTGMYFDARDMKTVLDVDYGSPAYNAGIRPGAVIQKINDSKFSYSKDDLMNGYKRFLGETMVYRDPSTRFTDVKGFPDCMFWSKHEYNNVERDLKKDLYAASFSYLYNFERYISSKSNSQLVIEAKVRDGKRTYKVTPEVRSSVTVQCK